MAEPLVEVALRAGPLLAAADWLDRPALLEGDTVHSWRQVHAASLALARQLRGAPAVCNLCASRLTFLVTFLAALRNRCMLILPPSGGNAEMDAVVQGGGRPVVVGDPEAWPEPWCGDRYLPCRPLRDGAGALDAAALAWEPGWDEVAVLLHTSGSTGVPQAQPKTLRQLLHGADALAMRLDGELEGGVAALERIVCSVPPQHMFGLECSVMLPLLCGMPVVDRRPLLPADVRDAFDGGPPGAWVATPMHLRSLALGDEGVPACRLALVSTMPLAADVALEGERRLAAPVLEIYGSTETGALALRRTARDPAWQPLAGVRLVPGEAATVAHGRHFASPVRVPDEIALAADGTFALLGRGSDLVKIAGRRASIAGLNTLLLDLPGLEDGVFYLPDHGGPMQRLCLIYAGPQLDAAATVRWLRARLDPVFLPRTFIQVERLPRTEAGKLRRVALDHVYDAWQAGPQGARPPLPAPAPRQRPAS